MSKKFNKVKDFYDQGFWTAEMVGNSVAKCWITEDEYLEITGEEYSSSGEIGGSTNSLNDRVTALEQNQAQMDAIFEEVVNNAG